MRETGFDNGLTSTRIGFVISARYAAVFAEPAKGALDDPAPGQYDEAFGAGRLADHFHAQAQRCRGRRDEWSLIAGISPEQLQIGGARLGLGEHGGRAHRVLYAGWLHEHSQRQALGIDRDMTFTANYLLACIVAVAAPLLPPVRTDCESMAPAVGSGSRVNWRTCWRSPWSRRSQVPSSRQASNCL